MSQRLERVAGEVRAILGEVLARDEIKDPRVRGAGLITVTHVRVSGDLRHALGAVHRPRRCDAAALERVRQGLNNASGYFRQAIARRLRMKVAPAVKFEVDQVFEQAERVEKLLREDAAARAERADRERRRDATTTTTMTTAATNSAGARPAVDDAVLVVDKPLGPDVVRRGPARAAGGRRAAGRPRRHAGPGGVGRVADLPGRGDQARRSSCSTPTSSTTSRSASASRPTPTTRRAPSPARRDAGAVDEAGVRRALAPFRGPITQVPPDLLGAQAGGAPALRLRARRRDGRAPRRAAWSSTSWS